MKKVISLILSIVMMFSTALCVNLSAYAAIKTGSCGENITYSLDESTGVLTISGTGPMTDFWEDYHYTSSPFFNNSKITTVIINPGITSIGEDAFAYCRGIKSVTIPESVTTICRASFYSCTSMTSVTIPNGVTSIGPLAFSNCDSLTSVTIPNSVTSIDMEAFAYCDNLKKLTLVCNSETIFDNGVFRNCTSLTNITIDNRITNIGTGMFSGCTSLTNIVIPESVTDIGNSAFYGCTDLTTVAILDSETNNGETSIGEMTFQGCSNLTDVTIGNSVSKIGDGAFSECSSLKSIVVPDNVKELGVGVFESCEKLLNVELPSSLTTIPWRTFMGCSSLVYIHLPEQVINIGGEAFDKCSSLRIIDFGSLIEEFPYYAFYRCINLDTIVIDENNPYLSSNGSMVFNKDNSILIYYAESNKQKSYIVPSGIKEIKEMAFCYNESIENIVLSDTVESVSSSAFRDCTNLKAITIPSRVNYYGTWGWVLSGTGVEDIYFSSTIKEWENKSGWYDDDVISNARIHCTDGIINDPSNVHASFTTADKTFSGMYGYYYKDTYFDESASVYNQSLATMSLCLAFSSYNANTKYDESTDDNVENIYKKCGFKDFQSYNYDIKPTATSVACAFGNKELADSTLIGITVRSGGYEAEWNSNINIGTSGDHQGFNDSAYNVYQLLVRYILENNIKGNVKIWISGFSRGAAISNLLAAKLLTYRLDMQNDYNVTYSPLDDIYAYCFATPAGAVIENQPHTSPYKNIFNIIEYNDPVPLVAPKGWKFDRYGTTKILPYKEGNKSNLFSQYKVSVVDRMRDMGYQYKVDIFRSATSWNNKSLGTFNRQLINKLSGPTGFGSRSMFAADDQYILSYNIEQLLDNNSNTNISIPSLITTSSELLSFAILHPILTKELKNNINILADSHANQAYYLAWMQSMDKNYYGSLPILWGNSNFRAVKVNCPVDVKVYDSNNKLVAAIINDEPQEIDDSSIVSSIDENEQKIIYLRVDEEYDVQVIARENCEVTYTIDEYNADFGDTTRVVNYSAVTLKEDEVLDSQVNAFTGSELENGASEGSSIEYSLEKDNKVIDPSIDIKGEEEIAKNIYSVTVNYDKEQGIVSGTGEYTIGSFVMLQAENKPGYDFEGFYIDGIKLTDESASSKYSVRFEVKSDVTVEAKYNTCYHDEYEVKTVSATCIEDGYTSHTCTTCGYSYNTDVVMATGSHNYVYGICSMCGEQDPKYQYSIIKQADDIEVRIDNEGDYCYYYFLPEQSGEYCITATGDFDTYGYIYDSNMNEITHNDDGSVDYNFCINQYLETGKAYIIGCRMYSDETTGVYNISIHLHNYHMNVVKPTCTDEGYTEYECVKCGYEFVDNYTNPLGHNYKTTSTKKATLYKNGSIKYKCSLCGETKSTVISYPKTIAISKTSYTYNGKVQNPSVTVKDANGKTIAASNYTATYAKGLKNVGSYTVTVTFKGNYSGTKKLTYKINPKPTALSKVTSPKSKQLKVTWKKQATQTTGYEIQYSTNSKFTKKTTKTVTIKKNKTTSTTIKKLTGNKKYYVRIRTYKTIGKTKCYSTWSKAKTVTTKK